MAQSCFCVYWSDLKLHFHRNILLPSPRDDLKTSELELILTINYFLSVNFNPNKSKALKFIFSIMLHACQFFEELKFIIAQKVLFYQ
jgi:hypothetical protein